MYNIENEKKKKEYEEYLSMDGKLEERTVLQKIASIRKYEEYTLFKDFKTFNKKQGREFFDQYKKEDVSFNTKQRALDNLKEFFLWLSRESGYKQSIKVNDINCFNLSHKEQSMANVRKLKEFPTLEQIYKVIKNIPAPGEQNLRDRALIAFCIATGARISALMSLKIESVDEYKRLIKQYPDEGVKTKRSKFIITKFFPVAQWVQDICVDWVKYLKEKGWGNNDYLFTAMKSELDEYGAFKRELLSKEVLKSDSNVRQIFKSRFEGAGIGYFHPHTFRDTLVDLGYKLCKTPEEFKAWSQNLGHTSPLTTFTSYGQIDPNRQMNIIENLWR